MSKKTISFPTAVVPSGARPSVADSRAATDAENWVRQKADAGGSADLGSRPVPDHSRSGIRFVLGEDASWLELLSFSFVLPYFATCYWISRASQTTLRQWIS
jgi:hypothetical protein